MSPKVRLNQRMRVILNMVTAFVVMILLTQLWLFTVAVDAAPKIAAAALLCSLAGLVAVFALIRFFLKAELSA
jgi:heme/copper-type cytochrome/quinol oxidase subunit 4